MYRLGWVWWIGRIYRSVVVVWIFVLGRLVW